MYIRVYIYLFYNFSMFFIIAEVCLVEVCSPVTVGFLKSFIKSHLIVISDKLKTILAVSFTKFLDDHDPGSTMVGCRPSGAAPGRCPRDRSLPCPPRSWPAVVMVYRHHCPGRRLYQPQPHKSGDESMVSGNPLNYRGIESSCDDVRSPGYRFMRGCFCCWQNRRINRRGRAGRSWRMECGKNERAFDVKCRSE